MKYGIIGSGFIVREFLENSRKIEGMEIKAISSRPKSQEKLKELSSEYKIDQYYTDSLQMLESDDFDTVYVGVPNHLHYHFSKKALEKGKNVVCEKPFCSNFRQAKDLYDLAEARNLMIIEALPTRFSKNLKAIKGLLAELGKIKMVNISFSQYSSRYDAFKKGHVLPALDPACSGGALMDLNVYNLNFCICLFGKPKDYFYLANMERDIDTSGVLVLDYKDFKCICVAAKDSIAPLVTTIQGDQASIVIEDSVNILSGFGLVYNKDCRRISYGIKDLQNYDKANSMFTELVEIERILSSEDHRAYEKLKEVSLMVMEILTNARLKAGIVFPDDK